MPTVYWFVVASGVVALLYGIFAARSNFAAGPVPIGCRKSPPPSKRARVLI